MVCIINFSLSFQAFSLKLCTDIISILKICMSLFAGNKIIFDKIYGTFDLDNLEFRFQ